MSPNNPKTELKISITSTLTNLGKEGQQPLAYVLFIGKVFTHRLGSAASASAALLPLIPTETPQMRLHMPTVMPAQKSAYPVYWLAAEWMAAPSTICSFAEKTIDIITP